MPPTRICAIKITASLSAALALASAVAAAPPAPPAPRGRPAEYEGAVRGFARSGSWQPMAELIGRLQFEGRQPARDLTLGSYYRSADWLKLGSFLRLQAGVRHDDDWISPKPGTWLWRDSRDRTEPVLVLDATPRVRLGGSWLGALKIRFEQNFFSGHEVLRLEPELSWFWLNGLKPVAHVALRYEADLSLNFGNRLLGGQWVYISTLWHGPGGLVIGPHAALREGFFSTSTAFKSASGGGTYLVRWKSLVLGFDALWRFGMGGS